MGQMYFSAEGITKTFGKFKVLNNISFSVDKNEFVCLLGPSGCGKTTLLRIIAGLEQLDSGKIFLGQKDISQLPPSKRNFGIVFQSYALFPNLTVYENIAYGLKSFKKASKEMNEKVRSVLSLVHLEQSGSKYPVHLSGGEQQRVALARALVLSPDFLLLDEPLSALDVKVRIELRKEMRRVQEKLGIATIMVTHDQEEALMMADKIVVMNNARIMQIGTPQEVYEKPETLFVADFIGAVNFFPALDVSAYMAIRPEDISVMHCASENTIKAVIMNMEYRGAFYRLSLQSLKDQGIQPEHIFSVDLSATLVKEWHLKKSRLLFVEFPQDKIMIYPECGSSVG